MLTTTQLWVNGFLVGLVLPLTLYSMVSPPARGGISAKLHAAEKYLSPAQSVFVLSLCALSALALARHFGLVGSELGAQAAAMLDRVFLAALAVFFALLAKASLKVRVGAGRPN